MPTCCAVGCSMRLTNKLSNVKFFRFPHNDSERKAKWVAAIKRQQWSPTIHSRICSLHFVEGRPSKDPNHVDWVPSRFAHSRVSVQKQKQAIDRFQRLSNRRERESQGEVNDEDADIEEDEDLNKSTMTEETQKVDACVGTRDNDYVIFNWKTDEKHVKFYTGISCAVFCALLDHVKKLWEPSVKILSMGDQLLLTLMKLRLGCLNVDLACRFLVSESTASLVFREWIERLANEMACLIYWPSRETVRKHLPIAFKRAGFKNVRCIVDCSEVFIDRPKGFVARSQTYSSYKNHNTLKFFLAVAPSGAITFVSKFWGGRVSDKQITKECGILEKLEEGDVVLADRGFLIEELLAAKGVKFQIPSFTRGKTQLSRKEVDESRRISNVRIHVERAIGRLKTYRILCSSLPINLIKSKMRSNGMCTADCILITCCALVNLQSRILKE